MKYILIGISIFLLFIIIFLYFWFTTPYNHEVIENINMNSAVSVEKKTPTQGIEDWEELAINLAWSYEYNVKNFNCWDFSTLLHREFKENGYDSRIVLGEAIYNPELFNETLWEMNRAHVWVELNLDGEKIWIESTTGTKITEEDKPYYKFGNYGIEKHIVV